MLGNHLKLMLNTLRLRSVKFELGQKKWFLIESETTKVGKLRIIRFYTNQSSDLLHAPLGARPYQRQISSRRIFYSTRCYQD